MNLFTYFSSLNNKIYYISKVFSLLQMNINITYFKMNEVITNKIEIYTNQKIQVYRNINIHKLPANHVRKVAQKYSSQ